MPDTCEKCKDRSLRIQSLERVIVKLNRGDTAFNWVSHEIGMRKKSDDQIRRIHLLQIDVGALTKAIDVLKVELGWRDDAITRRRADIRAQAARIKILQAQVPIRPGNGFLSRLGRIFG